MSNAMRLNNATPKDARSGVMQIDRACLLRMAAWFALLSGLVEGATLWTRVWFGEPSTNINVIWMAPLANLVYFLTIAGALILAPGRWFQLVIVRAALFVFPFLALVGLLNLFEGLAKYAMLLLSAGAATQISRIAAGRISEFKRVLSRTTAWATGIFVLVGAAVPMYDNLREESQVAGLPRPTTSGPNLLVIVLDTVRARSLSTSGYDRDTSPHLYDLAQKGVRFERAIATAPWTLLSHASMFTGRLPYELSANWQTPIDSSVLNLADYLREHGYMTAGFVANTRYCTYPFGLNRGFLHYDDYLKSPGEIVASSSLGRFVSDRHQLRTMLGYYDVLGRKDAATLNKEFFEWVNARKPGRPFFAFLNYWDAHEPYMPPPPYDRQFGDPSIRHNDDYRFWAHGATKYFQERMSADAIQAELDAYEGAIAYLDARIGELLDELERLRLLENTLVVLTSDHGEGFKEHGRFGHGNSLYMNLIHVPLIVSLPSRVPAGVSVREAVSLRDLPATVTDLLTPGSIHAFPGKSLSRFWENSQKAGQSHEPIFSELTSDGESKDWKGARQSVVLGDMHYIENGDGSRELYDLAVDMDEKQNVIDFPVGKRWITQFRSVIEELQSH